MNQYCDLHTHTNYSDGTLTPTELVRHAREVGLSALALTDHNTVAGLPEFLVAAEETGVEGVPGVELSTDYLSYELHIVGLFIQPEHYAAVTALTDTLQENKRKSNIALAEALNRAGYAVSYERIKNAMPTGEPNRALFAAELTRLGYTASNQEAFEKLLSPKHGYYQPPKRIDALEAVAFLKSIGAVAVLAHPFLSVKDMGDLRRFLQEGKAAGLDGMEVYYSKFTPEQTETACSLVKEFDLLPSGGSDFHGANKPDIAMGSGRGNLCVPHDYYAALKKAQEKR